MELWYNLLYKKRGLLECHNYRGITLLTIGCKIFSIETVCMRLLLYDVRELGPISVNSEREKSTIDQILPQNVTSDIGKPMRLIKRPLIYRF